MTGSPQPHLEAELERTLGVRFADHSARLTNPNEDELANAIAQVAEDYWAGDGGARTPVGDLVAETRQVLDHEDLRRLVAAGLMRADTADAYARVLEADEDTFTPELEAQATGVIEDMGLTPYDPAAVAELRDTSAAQAAELQDLAGEQGRTIDTAAYHVHLKTETGGDDESALLERAAAFDRHINGPLAEDRHRAEVENARISLKYARDDEEREWAREQLASLGVDTDEAGGAVEVGAVLADERAIDEAAARCEAARNDERADLAVALAEAAVAAAEAGERARERAAAAGESARSVDQRAATDADEWA